ncbi:T9SS type A sorting domain-containing protein [Hymenobacter properus]|uniref:T9SS type A sorting domain-containing protein n=1 Tax=Hymenobacter properus TaxID=2791026 RepID=A0A931BN86_9BACT|nr:T9SS type A sorting domain-containing protein [Hymenobacter properus]MBF9142525.1 T9SS type A sorting domain-containing protein [Hymenobacter properus]MBR7721332.1 T9SS type A sorting domain-containing protein [Microvirga sp. SRT04]
MKNYLSSLLFLLLLSGWLPGGTPQAHATQFVGGDLTYVSLGNDQYRVTLHYYQDCSGVLPAPFTLTCRNGSCGSAATLTAPLVQQGPIEAGNPFCAAISATPCQGPTGLPSYQLFTYAATVTLPAGQWQLSTLYSARPAMTNTVAGDLYVEATLDNRNSSTGAAVSNNSPQFAAQEAPVQYVCWRQPTTLTLPATEADGDSLAYALAAPLQACNTPVTYSSFAVAPVLAPVSSTSGPCFFNYAGTGSGYYGPTSPIWLGVDTVGFCPTRTGITRVLRFNAQAHTITFTPGVYNAPTGNTSNNRYQLAMLITEYRRINGVRRVVGTVRREITVLVTDCSGNSVPNPPVASNGINLQDTTRIQVRSCSYTRVELNFTDPDNLRTPSANQRLTVTLPPNFDTDPTLFGATDVGTFRLTGNGSTNPKAVMLFQPSPTAEGRTIRFNLKLEDDACPVKGVRNRVFDIRIFRGNYAVIMPFSPPPLCQGASMTLQGQILRADSVRNFTTNTSQLQPYTYQWSTNAGGNGLPAVTNTRDIAVNPTVTTRYILRVTPTLGYTIGCGDTTSVVVRVRPGVATPVITRNGQTLTSSYATGNQWYLNGQPIPGATGQSITITASGSYTVQTVVTGASGSCTSPMSAALTVLSAVRPLPGSSLRVVPNPTPDGRLQVTLTGYAQPVSLTVLDALGRKVAESMVAAPNPQGSTQEVNLSHCEAGFYLLQVRTASSLEIRRIVRQ